MSIIEKYVGYYNLSEKFREIIRNLRYRNDRYQFQLIFRYTKVHIGEDALKEFGYPDDFEYGYFFSEDSNEPIKDPEVIKELDSIFKELDNEIELRIYMDW